MVFVQIVKNNHITYNFVSQYVIITIFLIFDCHLHIFQITKIKVIIFASGKGKNHNIQDVRQNQGGDTQFQHHN